MKLATPNSALGYPQERSPEMVFISGGTLV
jgi:hypothetical protein